MMIRTVTAITLLAVVLCAGAAAQPAFIEGVQAGYLDGDTLTIGGHRVRLKGVNAPELSEWTGARAAEVMRELVAGADLRCELTGERTHDRHVGWCRRLSDGLDLNSEIVRLGWATACPRFSDRYVAVELAARAARRGAWSGPGLELATFCRL